MYIIQGLVNTDKKAFQDLFLLPKLKKGGQRMAKGSVGTPTNTIIRMKKPNKIACDCERCKHSKKGAGTIYCTYYDIISPKKKTCARYWGVKPTGKKKKKKKKNPPCR